MARSSSPKPDVLNEQLGYQMYIWAYEVCHLQMLDSGQHAWAVLQHLGSDNTEAADRRRQHHRTLPLSQDELYQAAGFGVGAEQLEQAQAGPPVHQGGIAHLLRVTVRCARSGEASAGGGGRGKG